MMSLLWTRTCCHSWGEGRGNQSFGGMCLPYVLCQPEWEHKPDFQGPHTGLSTCAHDHSNHTFCGRLVALIRGNGSQTCRRRFLVEDSKRMGLMISSVVSRSEFLHSLWWLRNILQEKTLIASVVEWNKIDPRFSCSWLVQFSFFPFFLRRSGRDFLPRNLFRLLWDYSSILQSSHGNYFVAAFVLTL